MQFVTVFAKRVFPFKTPSVRRGEPQAGMCEEWHKHGGGGVQTPSTHAGKATCPPCRHRPGTLPRAPLAQLVSTCQKKTQRRNPRGGHGSQHRPLGFLSAKAPRTTVETDSPQPILRDGQQQRP